MWSDPNRVEPFLNENARPPAAAPSIVNAKALGNISHLATIKTQPKFKWGKSSWVDSLYFSL